MLSPRYHLVTIVAIFLALGLGLLAGSSFGQPTLVGQLQERTDAQLRRIDELRGEVDAERARAEALASYASASAPLLLAGRLEGYRAVVVTQEGVPSALETSVLDALDAAGAVVVATLAAQPSLLGEDPADAAMLSKVLGEGAPDVSTPYPTRAAALLGARFAAAAAPVEPAADPLVRLLAARFLAARDGALDDVARSEIHAPQLLVVVLGGAAPGSDPLVTRPFVAALVRALAVEGVPVAAVEPSITGEPWAGELAGEGVVSVTGADEPAGAVAVVLGILELVRTGDGGAYGGGRPWLPAAP